MLHNLCKTSKVPFAINILALYQGYRDLTLILRGDNLVEVKTTVGNNLNSVDKKVKKKYGTSYRGEGGVFFLH